MLLEAPCGFARLSLFDKQHAGRDRLRRLQLVLRRTQSQPRRKTKFVPGLVVIRPIDRLLFIEFRLDDQQGAVPPVEYSG
jgi:hypothetical protein